MRFSLSPAFSEAAVLPLCLLQLVVPPASYLAGAEVPSKLLTSIHARVLALFPPKREEEEQQEEEEDAWLPSLRYMFTHSSYVTMLANMSITAFYGVPIVKECGALCMYALFFTGGMVAASARLGKMLRNSVALVKDFRCFQVSPRKIYHGSLGASNAFVGFVAVLKARQLGSASPVDRINTFLWLCILGTFTRDDIRYLRFQTLFGDLSWRTEESVRLLGLGIGLAAGTATFALKHWMKKD